MAISPLLFVLCLVFSASLAGGQLLFKIAANEIATRDAGAGMLGFLPPSLIAALLLYAATTVLWVYILTKLPLSLAYPFSLAGAVLVVAAAGLLLGETISVRQMAGIAVAMVGLLLIYL
jgi:drug/metabolite transporter (DMT)-like permease